MSPSPITEKIKPILAFLLAWAFLNVLMNIKYPAQQMHMLTLFKVSPEVLGMMMIPMAMAGMGLRFHPGLYLPLTIFVIFLRLFRFGDILVPMYFFSLVQSVSGCPICPRSASPSIHHRFTENIYRCCHFSGDPFGRNQLGRLAVTQNHPQLFGLSSTSPNCSRADRCRSHGAAIYTGRQNPPSRRISCQRLLSSGG